MVGCTCTNINLNYDKRMTRLIKKYKNRRLYDTTQSQYITIDDLHHYVIEGILFEVKDSTTNKDLTSLTLMQILMEMESGSTQFLSSDMLRQLICLAHHPMNQALKTMLKQLVDFMEKQIQNNTYFQDLQHVSDSWSKQMQDFLSQWQRFFQK